MLNEERSFSSLEEVTKLLIAAEGKTFRELDETGRGDSAETRARLAISLRNPFCTTLSTQMLRLISSLTIRVMSLK